MSKGKIQKALIYVRVSDPKQKIKGSGLESQEHRLRQHADMLGLPVEAVFTDDITGGGNYMKRPGVTDLLAYLKKHRRDSFVVIFDDLKRFARDIQYHWALRGAISEYGGEVSCANFKFDNTPEGRFVETIHAAQGQLEREQNKRQVIQKMTARFERGYYTMYQPIGYRYAKDRDGGGKILVLDEPNASIVREALEGYASGRFQQVVDVIRFLEGFPDFRLNKGGKVHAQNVSSMLRRVLYAGKLERPEWNIGLVEGRHEALISYETFLKIQQRLDGNPLVTSRSNRNVDFPLRGFIVCGACDAPLTSCWAKGRNGRHPYYHCHNKECGEYGKSIRRDVIEGEFDTMIRTLEPDKAVFDVAAHMFKDAWRQRSSMSGSRRRALAAEQDKLDTEIHQLLDKVVQVRSPTVMATFETRIEELENQKLLIAERIANFEQPKLSFDEGLRTALAFLKTPWKLWTFGEYEHKRLFLQLAFSTRVAWVRNEGLRTAQLTLPFKVLATLSKGGKGGGGGDWKHHSLDISHLRCISPKCTPHIPHLIDLRLFYEAASPQHSHALSTRLNSIEHALSAEDLKSCCRVGSRAKATCPRLLTTCGWL